MTLQQENGKSDENNSNVYGTFSTGKTGDLTNQQLDRVGSQDF